METGREREREREIGVGGGGREYLVHPIPDSADAHGGLRKEGVKTPQGQPRAPKNCPQVELTYSGPILALLLSQVQNLTMGPEQQTRKPQGSMMDPEWCLEFHNTSIFSLLW